MEKYTFWINLTTGFNIIQAGVFEKPGKTVWYFQDFMYMGSKAYPNPNIIDENIFTP